MYVNKPTECSYITQLSHVTFFLLMLILSYKYRISYQHRLICDPLWENRPNHQLLQNEIKARKVDAVITVVCDQKKSFRIAILTTISTLW